MFFNLKAAARATISLMKLYCCNFWILWCRSL